MISVHAWSRIEITINASCLLKNRHQQLTHDQVQLRDLTLAYQTVHCESYDISNIPTTTMTKTLLMAEHHLPPTVRTTLFNRPTLPVVTVPVLPRSKRFLWGLSAVILNVLSKNILALSPSMIDDCPGKRYNT